MKIYIKASVLILFLMLTAKHDFAQPNDDNYKKAVKDFYSILFRRNVTIGQLKEVYNNGGINQEAEAMICDSLKKSFYNEKLLEAKKGSISSNNLSVIIKQIRRYMKELTQDLDWSQISLLIDQSKIYDEGLEYDEFLELNFPNKRKVYFDLNDDLPTRVTWIYLDNGDLLEGKFYNNKPGKLVLVGMINDLDGYVNIRTKPTFKSDIVRKMSDKDIFYYSPNGDSDWYLVRMKENQPDIGYIHKSRIKKYLDFSDTQQKRVIEERN